MTSAYDIGDPPELLLAIMSGFYRRPALSACRSPSIRCLIFHDGTQTTASPDAELVPPSEYLTNIQPPLPTPPTPLSCCDTWWRGRPPRANGSSHFFCRPHVRETLSSQYRFLPALAHAASILSTVHEPAALRLGHEVLLVSCPWASIFVAGTGSAQLLEGCRGGKIGGLSLP